MALHRRELLKKSLMAAGAAVAGAAVVKALQAARPAGGPNTSSPATTPATTPALTTDHQLVNVPYEGGTVKPCCGPVSEDVRVGVPHRRWVMVVDLAKCDGCKKCTQGCQKMHFVPPEREWIKVFTMRDGPELVPYYFPKPCFHCDNPPCTRVCPVGATFKRKDGLVLIDNERCIGCRFCMAACPYSTRYFNWARPNTPPEATSQPYSPERGYPRRVGTVEKCDYCPDMAEQGKLPACAAVCPMGVIYFGDQNEDAVTNGLGETEQLSKLLGDRAGYRYMEELGTNPRLYYLAPKNRKFPAPGQKKAPEKPAEHKG